MANGVAMIIIPSTISSNDRVSAFVEMVNWVGVMLAGDVDEGSTHGLDDGSGNGLVDVVGSEFTFDLASMFLFDVGVEPPTVMFLTVS